MAFAATSGYNNLARGNFSPVIYSKKAQKAFRQKSVIEAITNNDYMGEINNEGDTVTIIKEPNIVVAPYKRGQVLSTQDLDDDAFTLVIDKANAFQFRVDDIEVKMAHLNWESMAADRAGYEMTRQIDLEVLGYMSGFKQATISTQADTARVAADKSGTDPVTVDDDGLLASMKLTRGNFSSSYATAGTAGHAIPIGPNPVSGTTTYTSPLQLLNRMKRLLDLQNVPEEGRWVVADPVFWEVMGDENSKLLNHDYTGTGENLLRNGMVTAGIVRGFRMYSSNHLPKIGSGPGTNTTTSQLANYGVVMAGHDGAVASAQQINKTESFRDPNAFGDLVRGLHLYGRKILRPEALVRALYNAA